MISNPTYRTKLARGFKATYLDDVLAVGLCFVLAHTAKLVPTLFTDASCQRTHRRATPFYHAFDMQVFKAQGMVAAEQISREFVQIVRTLVADFLMQSGHYHSLLIAVLAPLFFTSKAALLHTKAFQVARKELLVFKFLPLGGDQKRFNAQIQPYGSIWTYWFGLGGSYGYVHQNAHKIFARCRTAYRRGLYGSLKTSVQSSFNPLAFRQKHFTSLKINLHPLRQLKRLLAVLAFEARKRCAVAKEISESVVEMAQGHLESLRRHFVEKTNFFLRVGKLLIQLKISQRYPPHPVSGILGFKPSIIDQATTSKGLFQNSSLFIIRKQGVFVSA